MIAETTPPVDLRDDLVRTVRALHDDAWRRHEDTKTELARIAQAASLLGVQLDMVRPFAPTWFVDRRPSVADAHLAHARMCGCLNDSAVCCFASCQCHDDPSIDVEPEPPADEVEPPDDAHLRYLQGGIIPKPGQVLIGVDGPQVVIPLTRHLIPTQAETDEGGDPEGSADEVAVLATELSDCQHDGPDAAIRQAAGSPPEDSTTPEEPGVVAPPAHPDDRARAVAHAAGEILDTPPGEQEYRCRWCSFASNRSQAVGSHESSQHREERAAEKARREHEATRPAQIAAQMAEDLANYRGHVLACHDSECIWMVPVAKTGALDQLATHTLSEHGRAPSRRERTPQERP